MSAIKEVELLYNKNIAQADLSLAYKDIEDQMFIERIRSNMYSKILSCLKSVSNKLEDTYSNMYFIITLAQDVRLRIRQDITICKVDNDKKSPYVNIYNMLNIGSLLLKHVDISVLESDGIFNNSLSAKDAYNVSNGIMENVMLKRLRTKIGGHIVLANMALALRDSANYMYVKRLLIEYMGVNNSTKIHLENIRECLEEYNMDMSNILEVTDKWDMLISRFPTKHEAMYSLHWYIANANK